MLLYPSLAAGFLFVGVPLLVHLINLLRHRRTKWAAMDFLLASYRKQRKWIVMRQLLLLLARLGVATLLISLLAGLVGGRRLIGVIGGQTTHHVIVLDDSYSMRQAAGTSIAESTSTESANSEDTTRRSGPTAYDQALTAISTLARRLSSDPGEHQLTVLRASQAAMVAKTESASADAVADLAAQTLSGDQRLLDRLMSTRASALRTDLVPAVDLAAELIGATPADSTRLYVVSDFGRRDWNSPKRLAESLTAANQAGADIKLIDCLDGVGETARRNLAITDLTPSPDVWVAGVPVMMQVTVKNFSPREVKNVALAASVITYPDDIVIADPTATLSGKVQSLPAVIIQSIPAGQQLTKRFQVYIDQEGTHVVRVSLPDDVLPIDNTRVCTLPLAGAQRVLILDGDPDGLGAYHLSTVLDPGSQVRIGAIPEVRPATILRDADLETLSRYRAIYLVDLPEITERAASTLRQYVRQGGGLAWFLGDGVSAESYNDRLFAGSQPLLPYRLNQPSEPAGSANSQISKLRFGKDSELLGPIAQAGESLFGLVNLQQSWNVEMPVPSAPPSSRDAEPADTDPIKRSVMLQRDDGQPLAVSHSLDRGRIVTVLTGLDGKWNNWPSDPTFVVFLLQANAMLFSGASPPTSRLIDEDFEFAMPADRYLPTVTMLPPADQPPRLEIELEADADEGAVRLDANELAVSSEAGLDEFLQPGVSEWQRTAADGRTSVLPVASVLRVGESDLAKAPHAEIVRDLLPLEIEFISAAQWDSNQSLGGMSSFLLFLLILLGCLLGLEQALAAWASYHPKPTKTQERHSRHQRPLGQRRPHRMSRTRQRQWSEPETTEVTG